MHFGYKLHPIETTLSFFQVACFLGIRIRRICSTLCEEASSLTQMSSRTRRGLPLILLSLSGHLALGKLFFQTQIKTKCLKLTFACRSRCSGLHQKNPGSLAMLAFAAFLRPVSPHALALSLALSIGGVLGDGAVRRPFNPIDILPSCPAEVVESPSVLPPLQGSLPRLLLWRRSLCAPSIGGTLHTGAPSQHSQPVPQPLVLHVPALFLEL